MVLNLCFHGIGEPQRALEPDEHCYWVGVEQFDEMASVISRHPAVRITFDDGNASDLEHAAPTLLRLGLRATFFVVAGRLGRPGSLSSSGVRALADSGMAIGTHGMAHRPWPGLGWVEEHTELVEAAAMLSESAGQTVREAACPFGAYDRGVLASLRRLGYQRVYTVDGGAADPQAWLQSRTTVRSDHTPSVLEEFARRPAGTRIEAATRQAKGLVKRWR